ncbi:MAG: hypothetical protein ACFFD2_21905 [Promethearchaeota archaeon]
MDKNLENIEKKKLIIRKQFNTAQMVSKYPPRIFSSNKKVVYNMACPKGCIHQGQIIFSRWSTMNLPEMFISDSYSTHFILKENIFQYLTAPKTTPPTIEWYINFADRNLFIAYGKGLFAQDEMQVAEHPALGSLKECLSTLESSDSRLAPRTRDANSLPTPILIRGVERRVAISVEPNTAKGRPQGLYGNKFSQATTETIKKACKVLNPPTITNIIAMEAPKYGKGDYRFKQIEDIFLTAYTAFTAAKIESYHAVDGEVNVIINTGNWGTGAYGGNKTIMALLQIIAAKVAQIDKLVYHIFNIEYFKYYKEAFSIFENKIIKNNKVIQLPQILHQIQQMKFQWGFSDGN